MIDYLRNAYARYRIRYPIYFFHHLPKCGGTSVRQALKSWFHINNDYLDEHETKVTPPIDLGTLISHNCVSGHFGHDGQHLAQRYPQVFKGFNARRRYRVFTFIRNPLKMRCSLYRHDLKVGSVEHESLVTAIMSYNNYYARIMHIDERTWREQLDRYFFIGNADNLQESFDLLAEQIGKPKLVLPKSNTTKRGKSNTQDSLTEEQIAEFKAHNQLDYKIYEYVLARLDGLKNG